MTRSSASEWGVRTDSFEKSASGRKDVVIFIRRSEKSTYRPVTPFVATSSERIAHARCVLPRPAGPTSSSPASTAGYASTKSRAAALLYVRDGVLAEKSQRVQSR